MFTSLCHSVTTRFCSSVHPDAMRVTNPVCLTRIAEKKSKYDSQFCDGLQSVEKTVYIVVLSLVTSNLMSSLSRKPFSSNVISWAGEPSFWLAFSLQLVCSLFHVHP